MSEVQYVIVQGSLKSGITSVQGPFESLTKAWIYADGTGLDPLLYVVLPLFPWSAEDTPLDWKNNPFTQDGGW